MWQDAGFFSGKPDIKLAMSQLDHHISSVPLLYHSFSTDRLLEPMAPDKWSRKQVLGHLIDSAVNNLKRFTDIQCSPSPYVIQSYRQDDLVAINHYQQLPLDHLLQLWQSLNQQIIFVALETPAEKLHLPVQTQYNDSGLKTLAWLICDYVSHMDHHLKNL